jgi:hypothetical protein
LGFKEGYLILKIYKVALSIQIIYYYIIFGALASSGKHIGILAKE